MLRYPKKINQKQMRRTVSYFSRKMSQTLKNLKFIILSKKMRNNIKKSYRRKITPKRIHYINSSGNSILKTICRHFFLIIVFFNIDHLSKWYLFILNLLWRGIEQCHLKAKLPTIDPMEQEETPTSNNIMEDYWVRIVFINSSNIKPQKKKEWNSVQQPITGIQPAINSVVLTNFLIM